MVSWRLLFLMVLDALLYVEAKQPKLLVQLSFEHDHGLLQILNKLGCDKGTSLSSPSVNNIL
jgi:hypothetical protein